MKKSLIWITAGIATVGFAVPAFAAHGDTPEHIVPAQVTVPTATPVTASVSVDDSATVTSVQGVEDISGPCDEAEHANDPSCNGATVTATDDDATTNSVEDVSGPCDEAEHANDPRCTGVSAAADDTGQDTTNANTSHRGGADDSGHSGGSDG